MSWVKDRVFENADDFLKWLDKEFGDYIDKHINQQHTHHTWKPNHSNYPKYTTLQLHQNMRNTHVNTNGWSDIAQNITIGKDGNIVTGRDIQLVPVSALGHNGTKDSHPFAYEMIGNFDKGNDKLEGKQLESAIKISRYFYKKGKAVKFHRELLLPNGKVPKTCPGTGIEKDWFMDLVKDSNYDSPSPKLVEKSIDKPKPTPSDMYRVRKSWNDEKSQIGAYKELQNAIDLAKENVGYEVYDSKGKQVYPTNDKPSPKPTPKPLQLTYNRTLKEKMSGNDVSKLQEALNKLGFNCGKIDNEFGLKTKVALKSFQKKHLPDEVDGWAGKHVVAKINSLLK